MDKSFNDQELSDIMKEIEALEEGFEEASPVMQELAEMTEQEAIPAPAAKKPAPVLSMAQAQTQQAPKASATTSMSFKVSGELNLDLQFEIGGKVVCLEVTESGLHIQMEGGVTFSVPVTKAA